MVLQEKVLVVNNVVDYLIRHHNNRASEKHVELSRDQTLHAVDHHNEQHDRAKHIESIVVAHHSRAGCQPGGCVVLEVLAPYCHFVQIKSQKSKGGAGIIISEQTAALEKSLIGNQHNNRDHSASAIEHLPAYQVSQYQRGDCSHQIERASFSKTVSEQFVKPGHHQEVHGRPAVPRVFDVPAKIPHQRHCDLAVILHLVCDFRHVGFITRWDRHSAQPLRRNSHESRDDQREKKPIPITFQAVHHSASFSRPGTGPAKTERDS